MASTPTTIDRDCSALLHLDGTFGSQAFTDSSINIIAWGPDGQTNLDTAQKQFGPTSAYFDGTGDAMHVADNNLYYLPGDFTIDFWVRFEFLTTTRTLFSQKTDALNYMEATWNALGNFTFQIVAGGVTVVDFTKAWSPSTAVWYHIAVVHTGTNYIGFIDGTSLGNVTDTDVPADYSDSFYFGASNVSGSLLFTYRGWMDEIRIVKGTAVWTSNFTRPSAAYTQSFSVISTSTGYSPSFSLLLN